MYKKKYSISLLLNYYLLNHSILIRDSNIVKFIQWNYYVFWYDIVMKVKHITWQVISTNTKEVINSFSNSNCQSYNIYIWIFRKLHLDNIASFRHFVFIYFWAITNNKKNPSVLLRMIHLYILESNRRDAAHYTDLGWQDSRRDIDEIQKISGYRKRGLVWAEGAGLHPVIRW